MKVVLLEDVKKVGKKGEIVEVSDAYGRNVLIKKGLGLEGTATNVNNARQKQESIAHNKAVANDEAKILAAQLTKVEVTVKVRMGEEGRVFGSVTAKDISDAKSVIIVVTANANVGTRINFKGDQRLRKPSPTKILGTAYIKIVPTAVKGPNKMETITKATTAAEQLYRIPHRIPTIASAAGATMVASNDKMGRLAPITVNTTTMAAKNAVSTIALVFVCFIILHPILKGYQLSFNYSSLKK